MTNAPTAMRSALNDQNLNGMLKVRLHSHIYAQGVAIASETSYLKLNLQLDLQLATCTLYVKLNGILFALSFVRFSLST
jgi:hypothetical protein